MLKRLLELMGAAEAARNTCRIEGEARADTKGSPDKPVPGAVIRQRSAHDFGAVYAYAINEGIGADEAYLLGSTYAESLAKGMSRAYST